MNLDFYIFEKINQFASQYDFLDKLAIFFAKYFEYFLILFLLLFLIKNPAPERSSVLDQSRTAPMESGLVRGLKKYWLMIGQAFGAAILSRFVITNIIRWIWERPRPFVENQVNLLISHELTSSFPSGHAAFYFALSTVIYFYNKKVGVLFFIGSFLITLARVFSGVHWPSDILVGALTGIFSGWLVFKITKRFNKM